MDYWWYEDSSREPSYAKDFPAVGQGTLFFDIIRQTNFAIVVKPAGEVPAWQWIALEVYKNKAVFQLGKSDGKPQVLNETVQEGVGVDADERTSYWLSFDRDQLVVKYGKGYCMVETTMLEHHFLTSSKKDNEQIREKLAYLFNPATKKVIEFYDDCKPPEDFAQISVDKQILSQSCNTCEQNRFTDEPPKKKLKPSPPSTVKAERNEITENDFHGLKSESIAGKQSRDKTKSLTDIESNMSFSQYPLVVNWSHLVLDSNKVSLFDLDQNEYIFSANLPPACQELYANVARAESIDLDWLSTNNGQLRLTDAIRYSINTEGKILYNKLKEKATEFGTEPNPYETYLRVTLGAYRGNSPGVPYVLEIWPYKHYSPIHSHGNSYAIIKVLHGSINVHVHNKKVRSHDQDPLKVVTISKGDVTWISPNWYQTHRLINDTSGDYCATIQCYQYGDEDQYRCPYFKYISDENQIENFLPNSDFKFTIFCEKVLEEYRNYIFG